MSQKKKKKGSFQDKDILCGDEIVTKITEKNKKQKKITAVIKWKGEGKFFGPGIWYRVDYNGKRYFVEKDAIIKITKSQKRNTLITSIEKPPNNVQKQKKKVKKIKWINIHFVGCPDITKKSKQFKMHISLEQSSTFEIAEFKENMHKTQETDTKYDDDDEKKMELGDLGDICMIGGMQEMGRKRSKSLPNTQIQHIKNKLSVNEIYSLKGVESRSIRIHINPKKFTISELKSYIGAKFKIPATSTILLMYNTCALTEEDASIHYYGIQNHSCLLLCVSEAPSKKRKPKPKPQPKPTTNRRRTRAATINRNRTTNVATTRRRRDRATSGLPSGSIVINDGGIVGINNNNSLIPPQSISAVATGGIQGISQDKSIPYRKRVNKYCDAFNIERMTDLDIYTFDIDRNCIKMPCGHGMSKETLFAYAEAQFKNSKKTLKCPHLKDKIKNTLCNAKWNIQLVRKILLFGESPRISMKTDAVDTTPLSLWTDSLFGYIIIGFLRENTNIEWFSADVLLMLYQYALDKKVEAILRRPYIKRMMGLEIECAKNKFIDVYDYQKCINCSLFIYRKQVAMHKVKCFCKCPLCESKFCWLCSNEWKTRDKAQHCGNNECTISWTKQHLGILQKCKTKTIGRVAGIPEVRACPKCNELIYHVTACKHMSCRSCNTQFCFCCMKLYKGGWQCGGSSDRCPIAPRQKLKYLTNTNRGNVELFKLLH